LPTTYYQPQIGNCDGRRLRSSSFAHSRISSKRARSMFSSPVCVISRLAILAGQSSRKLGPAELFPSSVAALGALPARSYSSSRS